MRAADSERAPHFAVSLVQTSSLSAELTAPASSRPRAVPQPIRRFYKSWSRGRPGRPSHHTMKAATMRAQAARP